jgi:hypothetical protein
LDIFHDIHSEILLSMWRARDRESRAQQGADDREWIATITLSGAEPSEKRKNNWSIVTLCERVIFYQMRSRAGHRVEQC